MPNNIMLGDKDKVKVSMKILTFLTEEFLIIILDELCLIELHVWMEVFLRSVPFSMVAMCHRWLSGT